MSSLSLAEQETVIQYDRASDVARVYTHDSSLISRLEKRGFKATLENVFGGRVVAKSFEVPKEWVVVRPKARRSETQRAAAGQSLAKARQAQKDRQAASVSRVNTPTTAPSPSQSGTAAK